MKMKVKDICRRRLINLCVCAGARAARSGACPRAGAAAGTSTSACARTGQTWSGRTAQPSPTPPAPGSSRPRATASTAAGTRTRCAKYFYEGVKYLSTLRVWCAGAAVLGAVRAVPVRAGHLLEHHRGLQLQLAGGGHRAAPQLLLQAELHRAGRHVQLPGGPLHQVGQQ